MLKKSIGITKKVDNLGRVVIPKEYRRLFEIESGDRVEILAIEEGIIIRIPHIEIIRKEE